MGHVISKEGVATDPKKIRAMQDWPVPKDVSQLRGFLGLTGYYRKFVKKYGIIARPLTDLLKKEGFIWSDLADKAFVELKAAMITPPVLALPDFSLPFVIETDASSYGIGVVLMQEGHPLAFISKSLSPRMKQLSVYDKELLAIVYAVTYWSHYVGHQPFEVRTDHKTLAYLLKQKLTTPGQLSWLSKLMAFDFVISYKKGTDNVAADALSRVHSSDILCMAITSVSTDLYPLIEASWTTDDSLKALVHELEQNPSLNSKYSWLGDQLRRKGRLVVGNDSDLRLKIIHLFHNTSSGGHSGILATYKRLSSLFYWPNMEKQIRNYIRACDVCQRFKYDNSAYPGLLQPLPIPEEAWSQVSLDFIEGLPLSHGKSTILVVVDRLTKYAHFMCLSHPYTAMSVAQAFLDTVFKLHGLPTILVSDRDKVFLSKFWSDFFKLQGVELHLCTAYHPQSDGQTEVVNRCLETYLRCMCRDQPTEWSKWISLAEF